MVRVVVLLGSECGVRLCIVLLDVEFGDFCVVY